MGLTWTKIPEYIVHFAAVSVQFGRMNLVSHWYTSRSFKAVAKDGSKALFNYTALCNSPTGLVFEVAAGGVCR